MYSRWYTSSVILFWLFTMSWLIARKVLPPLLLGEPPNYHAVLSAQEQSPLSGWYISMDDRRVGWAINRSVALPDGGTNLCGHVHFDGLPLARMTPAWFHGFLKLADQPLSSVKMETLSTITISPQGHVSQIDSSVRIEPLREIIRLTGAIDGTRLMLAVRAADFTYRTEAYLPSGTLLGDSLSPQTQMPGLHLGQTWTVPAYSPLRPPNSPLEILQAAVETDESFVWNNDTLETWLVVYRSDSGFTFSRKPPPRGKMWVRHDGTVLQQEISVLDCKLTFLRMTDQRAAVLANTKEEER
jgi:hypothetical protein